MSRVMYLQTGFCRQTGSQPRKSLAAVSVFCVIGIRKFRVASATQDGHLVRLPDRERPQKGKVQDSENRRVDSDSERQAEHRKKGESRPLPQHTEPEAQILNQSLNQIHSPRATTFFFPFSHTTHFEASL